MKFLLIATCLFGTVWAGSLVSVFVYDMYTNLSRREIMFTVTVLFGLFTLFVLIHQ
jgi:hypothetical protein